MRNHWIKEQQPDETHFRVLIWKKCCFCRLLNDGSSGFTVFQKNYFKFPFRLKRFQICKIEFWGKFALKSSLLAHI